MNFFRSDDFLSSVLKLNAYYLGGLPSPFDLPKFFGEATSLCSRTGVFASAKVDVDQVDHLRVMEKAGFGLVDTNVTLERPVQYGEILPWSGTVRHASQSDKGAVRNIAAKNLTTSRFHLDPLIENSVAAQIKAEWAGNYFAGLRGEALVVAEKNGQCVGFLQLIFLGKSLVIDLIAVDKCARRTGAASAMIAYAERLDGDWERIVVGTQIANKGSIRFYQSLGFNFIGAKYVLHNHGGAICS